MKPLVQWCHQALWGSRICTFEKDEIVQLSVSHRCVTWTLALSNFHCSVLGEVSFFAPSLIICHILANKNIYCLMTWHSDVITTHGISHIKMYETIDISYGGGWFVCLSCWDLPNHSASCCTLDLQLETPPKMRAY
jgi:hypothetical protein